MIRSTNPFFPPPANCLVGGERLYFEFETNVKQILEHVFQINMEIKDSKSLL